MLGFGPLSSAPLSSEPQAAEAEVYEARGPLVINRPTARQQGFVQVAQNLLMTTLATVVVAAPFVPQQFQQPIQRRVAQQPVATANLSLTTLAAVQRPFSQTGWVQPSVQKRPYQPLLPDRHEGVTAPVAEQPPKTGEFIARPGDRARTAAQQPTAIGSGLGLLTYVAPQKPFNQADWPNPTLLRKVQQPLMPDRHEGVTEPPVEGGAPFTPYDWPQLRRSVHGLAAHFTDTGSYRAETTGGTPFAAAPTQPLVRVARVPQNILPQNLLRLLTAPPPVIPPRQLDWPNPTIARKVQQPFMPDRHEGVTEPPAEPGTPFTPYDWPNPQRLGFKLGAHAFDTGSYRGETPIIPVDWQSPIIARQVQQPAPINGVLQLLTYIAPPLPKNNSDWPNPTLPILPAQDTAQYQNPDLITPYVEPPVVVVPDGGIGGPDPWEYEWEYWLAKKLIAARLAKYSPPKDKPRLDPAERMLAVISKPAAAKKIPANPSRASIERVAALVKSQSKVDPRIAVAVIEAYIQRQVDAERKRRDQEEEDFLLLVAQAMTFYH